MCVLNQSISKSHDNECKALGVCFGQHAAMDVCVRRRGDSYTTAGLGAAEPAGPNQVSSLPANDLRTRNTGDKTARRYRYFTKPLICLSVNLPR